MVYEKIHQSCPDIVYNDLFGEDFGCIRQTFDVLKNSLHIREDILRTVEEAAGVTGEWKNAAWKRPNVHVLDIVLQLWFLDL